MVWSLGTPWSWRETTIWPSSMTRLTPSSLHQSYAQRSSRAVQPINQRFCYSQLQGMLPLHQPWLCPHRVKLPRNTCGHLPWTPRQSFRSSWRKPVLGWTRRASSSLYNFAVDIVASSLQQCAGCRASREVGFPAGLSGRQWVLCGIATMEEIGIAQTLRFWGTCARAVQWGSMVCTKTWATCRESLQSFCARAQQHCHSMSGETLPSTASWFPNTVVRRESSKGWIGWLRA